MRYNANEDSNESGMWIQDTNPARKRYTLLAVADLDTASKQEEGGRVFWESYLLRGELTRDESSGNYSVSWGEPERLRLQLNEGGRGMELSELALWRGGLYSCDDRTGLLVELRPGGLVVPRYVLMEGNGLSSKGFKCEWLAVKDGALYAGSIGKEWTDANGRFVSNSTLWVKRISARGHLEHLDWGETYAALRRASGHEPPGYLLHEAVRFCAADRRWYFLPRRASRLPYDEVEDEARGTNLLLSMDEYLSPTSVVLETVGTLDPLLGFSSFAFVPGRPNEFVALKTREYRGQTATYLLVYDRADHRVLLYLLPLPGRHKYEGIEIL
jgi:soluble calcium-activated nucleotidase 1